MWWLLWYALLIPVVGIPLLVATFLLWSDRYWKSLGFPTLPATFYWKKFLKAVFVTKSNGSFDLDIYKYLSGKRYAGLMELTGPSVWILDPELMKSIFVKDFDHFVDRQSFNFGKKAEYTNLMMSNLQGQLWKDVRNVVTPTFTSGKMKRIFPSVCQCANPMKDFFRKKAASGESFELKDAYGRFTMDVIASSAFGVQLDSFKDPDAIFPKMAGKFFNPGPLMFILFVATITFPRFINFLRDNGFPLPSAKDTTDFFADVVKDTVSEREKNGIKRNDFLQLLLDAKKGELQEDAESDHLIGYNSASGQERKSLSKKVMNEPLLISQCLLFFIAGYETTANTLSFAAYEMAINPDIQERLYEEVKEVTEKHNGQVTYESILEMELLDKVFYETLRLHTPAMRLARKCTKDYKIPGTDHVIPKDTIVMFPTFAIQRDEKYFPNPTKFDPERFSPEEKAKRHPYVFQAFGHGPRNCVGMRFAMMEAKAALALTVLNFRFHPTERTEIPITYSMASTLIRAKNGIWLRAEARN